MEKKGKDILEVKLKGISNITNMNYMFWECESLISLPDISQLDASRVSNMNHIFDFNCYLKSIPDISNWAITNASEIDEGTLICYFLKSFKKTLIEFQKTEEHKNFEFHIKSTDEELKGIKIYISNVKYSKFKEILEQQKDYIKKSLFVLSFSFNSNDENTAKSIGDTFKKIKPEVLKSKYHEINFKIEKKNISINVCLSGLKNGLCLLLEEILVFFELVKFDGYIKTGFSIGDLFYLSYDKLNSSLRKFGLFIKFQPDVLNACIQTLKGIKLTNDKYEKKLKVIINILNKINSKELSTQIVDLVSKLDMYKHFIAILPYGYLEIS